MDESQLSTPPVAFAAGVVHPVECLSAGWEIVRPQYWLMVAIALVGLVIGGFAPMGILMGPMMCGIYLCLFGRMRGERIEFGLLFKGFDYLVPSLVVTLVQAVPVFVILIPAYAIFFASFVLLGPPSGSRGAPSGPAVEVVVVAAVLVMLLIMAVSLTVGLFFMFAYPLVVDRKLPGLDACRASARAVRANLGGMLGLVLLNFALGMIGLLLCYVGALLLMPVGMAANAVAYRRVFGEAAEALQTEPRPSASK